MSKPLTGLYLICLILLSVYTNCMMKIQLQKKKNIFKKMKKAATSVAKAATTVATTAATTVVNVVKKVVAISTKFWDNRVENAIDKVVAKATSKLSDLTSKLSKFTKDSIEEVKSKISLSIDWDDFNSQALLSIIAAKKKERDTLDTNSSEYDVCTSEIDNFTTISDNYDTQSSSVSSELDSSATQVNSYDSLAQSSRITAGSSFVELYSEATENKQPQMSSIEKFTLLLSKKAQLRKKAKATTGTLNLLKALKMDKASLSVKGDTTTTSTADTVQSGAEIASACVSGFLSSIPPDFCYKKNADFGTIPTNCPSGYDRILALCVEQCKTGYKSYYGACVDTSCPSGYTKDIGLVCIKLGGADLVDFKIKSFYISKMLTNFSPLITCDDGKYKWGALCYKDCSNAFLSNCGIGACSASKGSCISGVVTMVVNFLVSLIQFVAFIASFGTDSAVAGETTTQAKSAFSKMMSKAEAGFKLMKSIATNSTVRKAFIKAAVKAALVKLVELGLSTAVTTAIQLTCEEIGNQMLDKVSSKSSVSLNIADYDPTGIASAVSDCKKNQSDLNNRLSCAASVMNVISVVDPTGLVGMAVALMQPICDV